MTMKKVSEMSDVEINRLIHKKVMGECCHEFYSNTGLGADVGCKLCECLFTAKELPKAQLPDYCTDLNAVAKAEAKTWDIAGEQNYVEALGRVVRPDVGFGCGVCNLCIVANSRQRSEAILIASGLGEL